MSDEKKTMDERIGVLQAPLKPYDIEFRVQSHAVGDKFIVIPYKTARTDMARFDEAFGALGWKREQANNNKNCIISVWDGEKNQWISKEDSGDETGVGGDKGLVSDSLKRAGFVWGIGRELYDFPKIFAKTRAVEDKVNAKNGKPSWNPYDNLLCTYDIDEQTRVISNFKLKSKKDGYVYFSQYKDGLFALKKEVRALFEKAKDRLSSGRQAKVVEWLANKEADYDFGVKILEVIKEKVAEKPVVESKQKLDLSPAPKPVKPIAVPFDRAFAAHHEQATMLSPEVKKYASKEEASKLCKDVFTLSELGKLPESSVTTEIHQITSMLVAKKGKGDLADFESCRATVDTIAEDEGIEL